MSKLREKIIVELDYLLSSIDNLDDPRALMRWLKTLSVQLSRMLKEDKKDQLEVKIYKASTKLTERLIDLIHCPFQEEEGIDIVQSMGNNAFEILQKISKTLEEYEEKYKEKDDSLVITPELENKLIALEKL